MGNFQPSHMVFFVQHPKRDIVLEKLYFRIGQNRFNNGLFCPENISAHDQIYFGGKLGQIYRFFQSRVSAAYHGGFFVSEKGTVTYRTVGNAFSNMFLFSRNIQKTFFGSCGNQNGGGCKDSPVFADDLFSVTVQNFRYVSIFVNRSETGGMFKHIHSKLRTWFFFSTWPVADLMCF